MSVKFCAHLYIRVDRPLRAALLAGAEAAGESVSEHVRRHLRVAVLPEGTRSGAAAPSRRGCAA